MDRTRLFDLLEIAREETDHLRRIARYTDVQLFADQDILAAVKHRLLVAIEATIDSARHLIASEGFRLPADYADAFEVLAENRYIPADLLPKLRRMAGFRNLLVHGYAGIDDARVIEIMRNDLGDIDAFRSSIATVLDS